MFKTSGTSQKRPGAHPDDSATDQFLPDLFSWLFAALFFSIGMVNLFWGNDPGFGAFIVFLSFVFIPPTKELFFLATGRNIPLAVKIFLGLFIIWASMGVGELPDKVDLMLQDFRR